MKALTLAERLIVAADFKPDPGMKSESRILRRRDWVRDQVLALADSLEGTGVYLKVNSALRACGYGLIEEIQSRGLRVFADLKLYDIPETLSTDGALLMDSEPDLLTTVCSIGAKSLTALKASLPGTEVLGVTILTSLAEDEVGYIHGRSIGGTLTVLAKLAKDSGLDGLIASGAEAQTLRELVGDLMTINTPAIRPAWSLVTEDDQNLARIMTPAKAIQAGANRLVIGRPIIRAGNPRDAVMRTLHEISSAIP